MLSAQQYRLLTRRDVLLNKLHTWSWVVDHSLYKTTLASSTMVAARNESRVLVTGHPEDLNDPIIAKSFLP